MRVLLYIGLLFVMASCASFGNIASDAEIMEKLAFNQDKIKTVRGMGDIRFALNDKSGSVDAVILGERDGGFRLETGNHFGVPLMAMTIYEDKLSYYVIPEEKIYHSKPAALLALKVLPMGLSEAEIRGILFFSKETYLTFKKDPKRKIEYYKIEEDERSHLFYPRGVKIIDRTTDEYVSFQWEAFDINLGSFSKELFKIKVGEQVRVYDWKGREITPIFQGHDDMK